jgi:lysine-specific demethylase 8
MEEQQQQQEEVLREVCRQGGLAYVSLAARAAGGDASAADAAHEMAWEQLHAAPWHSVHPAWRDAYSLSCLHLASAHLHSADARASLRVLDMGLLMGGLLLKARILSAIAETQKRIASAGDAPGDAPADDDIRSCSKVCLAVMIYGNR